jgi:hypothetical protein
MLQLNEKSQSIYPMVGLTVVVVVIAALVFYTILRQYQQPAPLRICVTSTRYTEIKAQFRLLFRVQSYLVALIAGLFVAGIWFPNWALWFTIGALIGSIGLAFVATREWAFRRSVFATKRSRCAG